MTPKFLSDEEIEERWQEWRDQFRVELSGFLDEMDPKQVEVEITYGTVTVPAGEYGEMTRDEHDGTQTVVISDGERKMTIEMERPTDD